MEADGETREERRTVGRKGGQTVHANGKEKKIGRESEKRGERKGEREKAVAPCNRTSGGEKGKNHGESGTVDATVWRVAWEG